MAFNICTILWLLINTQNLSQIFIDKENKIKNNFVFRKWQSRHFNHSLLNKTLCVHQRLQNDKWKMNNIIGFNINSYNQIVYAFIYIVIWERLNKFFIKFKNQNNKNETTKNKIDLSQSSSL